MKKPAIIITLGIFAIIVAAIFWLYQSSDVPEHSKRPPILFPPQVDWPPDVITAISQFKELKGKYRRDQVVPISMYAYRCEQDRLNGHMARNSAPLTKSDVFRLLGTPDFEEKYIWMYQASRTEWSVDYLSIFFNRNRVSFIGGGAGQCARPATKDEITAPPDENETEQSGPAYPPQGVGSADP